MIKMICSFCKQDVEIGHSCVTEIKDIKDLPYPLHIDENGKALDDDYNEYSDETGCCVYVEKKYRHNFRVIKL